MLLILTLFAFTEVVYNEITPADATKLEVVHEFTLGDGSKDDLFFSEAVRVVASADNIYVLDPGNFRVLIFDAKGRLKKEFGKQGQGPGEWQGASAISLNKKGQIAVFDTGQKRVNFYNQNGEFVSDARIEQGIQHIEQPFFLENGHLIMMSIKTDAQFQMTYDFSMYDPTMAVKKNFHSNPLPPTDWSKASEPNFWVDFLKNQFEGIFAGITLGVPVGTATEFALINSNSYKGEIHSQEGSTRLTYAKKYKPKGFTKASKFNYCEGVWEGMTANPFLAPNITRPIFEKAVAKTELPDFLPPASAIFQLSRGFAIISNYDTLTENGHLDYFDPTGTCVSRGDYSGPRDDVFGYNDRLYVVGANAEDTIVVKVFRVNGLPK